MRPILFLVLPCLVAGCIARTPQSQCIAAVPNGGALVDLNRLIRTTQGNIDRGYALAEVSEVITRPGRCEGENEDGTTFRFECDQTETRERQEPVAIDIAEERRKLASLVERRGQLQPAYDAGVAACRASYPE